MELENIIQVTDNKPEFLAEGIPVREAELTDPAELDQERIRLRRELIRIAPIA